MMDRRAFIRRGSAAILCAPSLAPAQSAKVYRIGVVLPGGPYYGAVEGLKQGLKDAGLLEQTHYILLIRDEKGELGAAEAAARSLEHGNVDVIFALPTSVSVAVKRATDHVPIVFWAGADAVDAGLVDNLAKPGGRLTGVSSLSTLVTAKRLQLLKEMSPGLRRAVTFYDPANPTATRSVALARSAAQQLGIELVEHLVRSIAELQTALRGIKDERVDAIFIVSDGMVISQARAIADFGKANKVLTMFTERSAVLEGGLASYGANYRDIGRMAADYVYRVLHGTNPGDPPVANVDRLEFVVNARTAREIGLTIPALVLTRADDVIE